MTSISQKYVISVQTHLNPTHPTCQFLSDVNKRLTLNEIQGLRWKVTKWRPTPSQIGDIDDNCKALIKDLKQALKVKDERIDEMSQHIHFLETDLPLQNKKRKLDSLGEIDEEMIKDTYNKDLKIRNLLKEKKDLKGKT